MNRGAGMRRMRAIALLVLGALAVHQLRYLLAFGPQTGEALHREGHGYLAQALPLLVALAAATLAAGLLAGALTRSRERRSTPFSLPVRGLTYAGALLLVFVAQELAEGAVASGHPAGLAALIGGGAWLAVPVAVGLGLSVASAERLLDRVERVFAERFEAVARPASAPAPDPPGTARAAARAPLATTPLAFGLARRPPPGFARP